MSKISRKVLKQADEQCRVAEKIYHYRCDVLPEDRRIALRAALDKVQDLKEDRELESAAPLEAAMEALEAEMKLTGGTFYPKKALNENVEVLLVAALLAIGIRMFFLQPFRIPTNSMYPTYNGMTYELFMEPENVPSLIAMPVRAVALGADRIEVEAAEDGEIVIPLVRTAQVREGYTMRPRAVKARKWFGLLPTTNAEFQIMTGRGLSSVQVPLDFHSQLPKIIWEKFGAPTPDKLRLGPGGVWMYHTGVQAKKGDTILCFDILLGDQLFVDRVSYHFRRPKVGEPIVFRTDSIAGMDESERGKYYIKRLVGKGGDSLQVREPVLYRNGSPIEGAAAFEANAKKEGEYEGYLANISLRDMAGLGSAYTVPEGHYFAMGDNSDESADSRVWGDLPEKAVIGRALVIYYPFTKHLGAAK